MLQVVPGRKTYQYTQVNTVDDLPAAADHAGDTYQVLTRKVDASWPFFHRAGLYYCNGSSWTRGGKIPTRAELGIGESDDVTFGTVEAELRGSAGTVLHSRSLGDWIDNEDGTITCPEEQAFLYSDADFHGAIKKHTIPPATTGSGGVPNLTDGDTSYIVIDYNSGNPRFWVLAWNELEAINESTVLPYLSVYRKDNSLFVLEWMNMAQGLTNLLHQRSVKCRRFERHYGTGIGLVLSESGTRYVDISAGAVWHGATRVDIGVYNSNADTWWHWYWDGDSWEVSIVSAYNNSQYNPSGGLTALTDGHYNINWIYRAVESNKTAMFMLDENEYATIEEAKAARPRTIDKMSKVIFTHAILVGRIITKKGAATGYIESTFHTDRVCFPSAAPTDFPAITALSLTVKGLTVTNAWTTTFQDGNSIRFDRASANYISATNANGTLSFGTGGRDTDFNIAKDGSVSTIGNVSIGGYIASTKFKSKHYHEQTFPYCHMGNTESQEVSYLDLGYGTFNGVITVEVGGQYATHPDIGCLRKSFSIYHASDNENITFLGTDVSSWGKVGAYTNIGNPEIVVREEHNCIRIPIQKFQASMTSRASVRLIIRGYAEASLDALLNMEPTYGGTEDTSGLSTTPVDNIFSRNIIATGSQPFIICDCDDVITHGFQLNTGGVRRWVLGTDATAEGGSNAGSDLNIWSYNDAGSYLKRAVTIKRSDGKVTLPAGLRVGTTNYFESGSTRWQLTDGDAPKFACDHIVAGKYLQLADINAKATIRMHGSDHSSSPGQIHIYGNGVLQIKTKSNTINLPALPTSASGLGAGDLWNNSGVVTIV